MPGTEVTEIFLHYTKAHNTDLSTACFNVGTGDVEDAPALDPLAKFDIIERDGAVYIKGEEATIKASRRQPSTNCSPSGQEKVLVIGGYGSTVPSCFFEANYILHVQWQRSHGRSSSPSRTGL